jgi:putative heme-binding domain-containing protein
MPKVWSRDNDLPGLKLVHDWIGSLAGVGSTGPETSVAPTDAVGNTTKSLRLLSQLLFEHGDQQQRLTVAKTAASEGNPLTAALFERFLPADQRRTRLGSDIDAKEILAIKGDAQRGRERFLNGQAGQCTACHRLQGSGQSVGADLDAVGKKRTRQQLLESILDPSKEIEPKYSSHLVLTADGIIVTGLKIDENDDVLVIRSADGKDHRISRDEIESFKIQPQSLMPAGLAAEMTAQELADLLEFLCSLK